MILYQMKHPQKSEEAGLDRIKLFSVVAELQKQVWPIGFHHTVIHHVWCVTSHLLWIMVCATVAVIDGGEPVRSSGLGTARCSVWRSVCAHFVDPWHCVLSGVAQCWPLWLYRLYMAYLFRLLIELWATIRVVNHLLLLYLAAHGANINSIGKSWLIHSHWNQN